MNSFFGNNIKSCYRNSSNNSNIFDSFEGLNESNCQAIIVKGKRKKYLGLNKDEFNEKINDIFENVISGGGDFKKMKKELTFESGKDNSDL